MHRLILVAIVCLQAVNASRCAEDSRTYYFPDYSSGCKVYRTCENSQWHRLTCPSGQAFNYATLQCEEESTVSCNRTHSAIGLAGYHQEVLIYCKHYKSCTSSRHPYVSEWRTQILGGWNVYKLEKFHPGLNICVLKMELNNDKEVKDMVRYGFAEIFKISEDPFLTFFFDDKPQGRTDFPAC